MCFRIIENVGSLPEVAENKGREYTIPSLNNRLFTEMTHVSIESFSPGNTKKDCGKDNERSNAILHQKANGIRRTEGKENLWRGSNREYPGDRKRKKSDQHDRPERPGDTLSPFFLEYKQGTCNTDTCQKNPPAPDLGKPRYQPDTFNR